MSRLILAALCLAATFARAETAAFEEYKVKAAYLYNIAKFVAWPDSALPRTDGEFVIGILGTDPFGQDLDDLLVDRTVEGRRIRIARWESVGDMRACQILFISRSMEDVSGPLLARLSSRPILTVSDMTDFYKSGGMITFFLEGDGVRFEVNQDAALKARLRVSAKLLSLSKRREDG